MDDQQIAIFRGGARYNRNYDSSGDSNVNTPAISVGSTSTEGEKSPFGSEQPVQRSNNQRNNKMRWCYIRGCDLRWFLILVSTLIALAALALGIYIHIVHVPAGTMYERLGNKRCPEVTGTSLVYSGIAVGFETTNSSTTFKCMPQVKEYIHYYKSLLSEYGETPVQFVHLARYETFLNRTGDVACAKCSTEGRGAIELLPTTIECPSSWTKEYAGYLMTDSGSSGFVCVDRSMEPHNSSNSVVTGPTLTHVVAALDSKYNSSQVLSCVVCSK